MFIKHGFARVLMALYAAALLTACAGLGAYRESPRVSLVSIEPLDMTLLEQRYALQLRIMNPNDADMPINGLSYTIEINKREFAYGVSRQAVTIPAYSEAVLEVEVVSSLLGMLRQLRSMQEDKPAALDYRLSGKLGLANSPVRLPFEYTSELNWLPAEDRAPVHK